MIVKKKDLILKKALPHVSFDGWGQDVLTRAGKEAKIGADTVKKLFPRGTSDLVHHFFDWADREMLKKMAKKDLDSMRIRDRVTLGVRARLETLVPHKDAVRQGLAFLAKPPHCFIAPKYVWQTADKIWWQSGDNATDYNHYTKRILLSGVLTKTTLYWLNDTSENHEKTWQFLDRRIDNVLKIGQKISKLKRN